MSKCEKNVYREGLDEINTGAQYVIEHLSDTSSRKEEFCGRHGVAKSFNDLRVSPPLP